MEYVKKLIVPIFGIVSFVLMYENVLESQYIIPAIIVLVYFVIVLLYSAVYHKNMNNKLTGKNSVKIPDLRVVSNLLIVVFSLIIVTITSWYVLPIMTYPEEVYQFDLGDDIDDFKFEQLTIDLYELTGADEITFYDRPNLSVNSDLTIEYFNFIAIVKRGEDSKLFIAYYDNDVLEISNTFHTGEAQYSFNQGVLMEDFPFYDMFKISDRILELEAGPNDKINIYPSVSAYGEYQKIAVTPTENHTVYIKALDGSSIEVTEYSEFNEEDYFVISIVKYDKNTTSRFTITYVFERDHD